MLVANIKHVKKCVFCKYRYDPTNEAIKPGLSKQNIWEYDETKKKLCMQKVS